MPTEIYHDIIILIVLKFLLIKIIYLLSCQFVLASYELYILHFLFYFNQHSNIDASLR